MIDIDVFLDRLFKILAVCCLIILTIILGLHASQDDKIIKQENKIKEIREELRQVKAHVIGNSLKQLQEETRNGK